MSHQISSSGNIPMEISHSENNMQHAGGTPHSENNMQHGGNFPRVPREIPKELQAKLEEILSVR